MMWEVLQSVPYWQAFVVAILALFTWIVFAVLRSNRPNGKSDFAEFAGEPAPTPEKTVSVGDIERDYDRRARAVRDQQSRVDQRILELQKRVHETTPADILLHRASDQERLNLATILKQPDSASAPELVDNLRRAGSHVVGRLFRRGEGVDYAEVVRDVASKLGASLPQPAASIYEHERAVLDAAFRKLLDQASPEQKQAILADLARADRGSLAGIGATTVTLAAAHLSGFALYTAASATLGAITSAVGVTLPFATYMGMSSLLATITGPIGWSALGAWAVFKLGGVEYKKTIPAVVLIASVRTRMIAERDQELHALADERKALEEDVRKLEPLRQFLETVRPFGRAHRVSIREVPL